MSITQHRYKSYRALLRRRWICSGLLAAAVALHFLPVSGTLIYSVGLIVLGVGVVFWPPEHWPSNPMRESYYHDWLKLPTLEEYWQQNPQTKTSAGPACKKCGSRNLKNWGLAGKHDGDRLVSCHACGTELYRI